MIILRYFLSKDLRKIWFIEKSFKTDGIDVVYMLDKKNIIFSSNSKPLLIWAKRWQYLRKIFLQKVIINSLVLKSGPLYAFETICFFEPLVGLIYYFK
jgi:hypothetical protein